MFVYGVRGDVEADRVVLRPPRAFTTWAALFFMLVGAVWLCLAFPDHPSLFLAAGLEVCALVLVAYRPSVSWALYYTAGAGLSI